jgi:hypothetical protein
MATVDKNKDKIKQKLQIAEGLFNLAYSTKYFQLKKKHPEWSHEVIHLNTIELIEKGCA